MKNFESENTPHEEINGKENKSKDYKSSFTKFYEQKAKEEREKIKKLMEENEKLKKYLDDLSI